MSVELLAANYFITNQVGMAYIEYIWIGKISAIMNEIIVLAV